MLKKTAAAIIAAAAVTLAAPGAYNQTGSKTLDRRITHGKKVDVKSYPEIVSLINHEDQLICGGTILDANSVLTAAHCCVLMKPDQKFRVRAGSSKYKSGGVTADVKQAVIHPVYEYLWPDGYISVNEDICVVKISPIPENKKTIEYARLSDKDIPPSGDTILRIAAGWGAQSNPDDESSENLLAAFINAHSYDDCRNENPFFTDVMICAGSREGNICTGDSGGPLLHGVTGVVEGVTSMLRSHTCDGNNPGFFVQVSKFLKFINHYMGDKEVPKEEAYNGKRIYRGGPFSPKKSPSLSAYYGQEDEANREDKVNQEDITNQEDIVNQDDTASQEDKASPEGKSNQEGIVKHGEWLILD